MGYANLLVQNSDGSSVLELLHVVLSSGTAVLAVGDLDSTLVGRRSKAVLDDSGAKVTRELQERERSTRLDNNGLETIVKHVRGNQLELLGCNELDDLA